jgi:hypothetical protein
VSGADSFRRVTTLAEACHRYSAIIRGLGVAVHAALEADDLPPAVREMLDAAARDAEAQVTAVGDTLKRALEDLPEGAEDLL